GETFTSNPRLTWRAMQLLLYLRLSRRRARAFKVAPDARHCRRCLLGDARGSGPARRLASAAPRRNRPRLAVLAPPPFPRRTLRTRPPAIRALPAAHRCG